MRDMLSNIQYVRAPNQTLSGTTPNASQAFDRRGFDGLTVVLETGVVTDAGDAAGFTMKLQHSDTLVGTSFVDVPADQVVSDSTVVVTDDAADTVIAGAIGYVGGLRYVRALITGSTGTNAVVHCVGVMGKPHRAPVTVIGASLATT